MKTTKITENVTKTHQKIDKEYWRNTYSIKSNDGKETKVIAMELPNGKEQQIIFITNSNGKNIKQLVNIELFENSLKKNL